MNISIIGSGAWGTTIGKILAENGLFPRIWSHDVQIAKNINESHENIALLPGISLPSQLSASTDLTEVCKNSQLVILVTASQFYEDILNKLKPLIGNDTFILSATKGLSEGKNLRMSQLVLEKLGGNYSNKIAVLSGPNISSEIARQKPATTVISSANPELSIKLQQLFSNKYFRVYTNNDVSGTEWGGTLKNIYAIAAGIIDGLDLGSNAKSAIMVRGLVEMIRFAENFGARKETLYGLAGMGDLITTCSSQMSRNHFVGECLGKGEKLQDILKKMTAVSEGVSTCQHVYHLAQKHKIEMPVTEKIYQVLFEDKPVDMAISELMSRESKSETM